MRTMCGSAGVQSTKWLHTLTSPSSCLPEPRMTTPYERTKAVIDTRVLLQVLASANHVDCHSNVQSVAERLLRHYPLDVDLAVSAAALPGVWSASEL
ncbi:BPSL0761 family protein [Burkholderia ambifaria]|uniref:BPSL0761 family protein n=2 Tax=Burkholderia ambifaria TaxID=152480 RepID=UPI0031FD0556